MQGLIKLLPALPNNWPVGSVKGIRTRGGFEVDMEWEEGKLTQAVIRLLLGNTCEVHYRDKMIKLELDAGESCRLDSSALFASTQI